VSRLVRDHSSGRIRSRGRLGQVERNLLSKGIASAEQRDAFKEALARGRLLSWITSF
jgi:hypothetical protein